MNFRPPPSGSGGAMATLALTKMERTMNQRPIFWAAFWTGLAGPMSLYAAPPPYWAYLGRYSVAYNFAQIGMALTRASALFDDGRTSEASDHAA
jgi:hypothetical protein